MNYEYELTHFNGDMGHGVASDSGTLPNEFLRRMQTTREPHNVRRHAVT